MVKDPDIQAEKLYRQMLDLLEELAAIYTDASEEEEEDDDSAPVDIDDVIDGLVEEAVERGLDEEAAERVLKAAVSFAKKSAED